MFFYRLFDSRAIIRFDFSMVKILSNTAVLVAMAVVNQLDFLSPAVFYGILAALFLTAAALNIKDIMGILAVIIPKKLRSKIKIFNKPENNEYNQPSGKEDD